MKIIHRPGEYEKMFVINNHEKMSASRMAVIIGVEITWVYTFCAWMKIQPVKWSLYAKKPKTIIKQKEPEEVKEETVFIRPAAVYSNRSPYGIADEMAAESAI